MIYEFVIKKFIFEMEFFGTFRAIKHDLRPPRRLGSPLPVLGLDAPRVRLHVCVRLGGGPAPPGRGALLRHPGRQPPHVVRREAVAGVLGSAV